MPIFVLILVSAVALIAGLSVFFLRYLTEGRRLRAARAAVVLFDVLGVGAMLFLFASHRTEGWAGMIALPIFLGYVAQIIALLLTMLAVLVRAAGRRLRGVPYSPARRRVLKCAALYPAAGALLGSYGAFIERTATVRRDYRIPIRNLPPEADGLVIAQISDVHLGAFFSVEELDALLRETAAGGADL
ncbi:MAG: metallophosphoesterase, partial [Selenomonas sp.]|nr:metallophosphoesterase [Selenomonas sp.]